MYSKSKTWRRRSSKKSENELFLSALLQNGNEPLSSEMEIKIALYALRRLQLLEKSTESALQMTSKFEYSRNETITEYADTIETTINNQTETMTGIIASLSQLSDVASIFIRQKLFVTALENIRQSHLQKQNMNNNKNDNGKHSPGNETDNTLVRRTTRPSFTFNEYLANGPQSCMDTLKDKYPLIDIHAQMQDVKNVLEKHHRRSKLCMRHVDPIRNTNIANALDSSTFTYNVINLHLNHKQTKEMQMIYETLYKCDEYDSIDIFKFDELTDGWSMSLLLPIMFEQNNFFDSNNMGDMIFNDINDNGDAINTRLPLYIDRQTLQSFLEKIQLNYFDVPYHNRIHASDVLQTAFFWLSRKDSNMIHLLNKEDIFVILISCVIHDLQHPGTSQMFLLQAEHPITKIYNDSDVLEHMHLSQAFLMIKSDQSMNIFKNLKPKQISLMKEYIIDCVLATNFAHQPKLKNEMKSFMNSTNTYTNIVNNSRIKNRHNTIDRQQSLQSITSFKMNSHIINFDDNSHDRGSGDTNDFKNRLGRTHSFTNHTEMQNQSQVTDNTPKSKQNMSHSILQPKGLSKLIRKRAKSNDKNKKNWNVNKRVKVLSQFFQKKTSKSKSSKSSKLKGSKSSSSIKENINLNENNDKTLQISDDIDHVLKSQATMSTELVNHVDDIQMAPIPIDFLDNAERSKTILSSKTNGPHTPSFSMSVNKVGGQLNMFNDQNIAKMGSETEESSSEEPMWSAEMSIMKHKSKYNKDRSNQQNGNLFSNANHTHNDHDFIPNNESIRSLLRRAIVHGSDISHCAKPLLIHQEWSERYYQETYVEKHILKTMNLVTQVDMKRKEFPKEQVWFIANLIHPFYKIFLQFIDSKKYTNKVLQNVESNLNFWKNDPKASYAHEFLNEKYAGFTYQRQRSRLVSKTMSFNAFLH